MVPAGILRGLSECSSRSGALAILALDHRQNLRRDLRPSDPGSVTDQELTDFKRAAVRALAEEATGVLLDPLYGAAQVIGDGSLPGSVGLVVALEETGYAGPATDRRTVLIEGWSPGQVQRLGASAAKLLVYYNADAPSAADQEELVADAAHACHEVELPLFLEPLTFSLREGEKLAGEERRRAVVQTARRLSGLGVDVLKLEFPYDAAVSDHDRWADACAEISSVVDIPWVLLSGGVDSETFSRQVEIACEAGASGVAAGRAVWGEATQMAPAERDDFLATTARQRMADLRSVIERHARPWRAAMAGASYDHELGPDWFVRPT